MKDTGTWSIIKETFSEWSEDKVPRLAAALAYYTIFSIAPILVIAIAVAGLVFGERAAEGQINQQLQQFVGPGGARTIQDMVAHSQNRSSGIIASIIGLGALLFGATGLFAELKNSLNAIWEVETKPGNGIWQTVRERFLSFTMVLGIGFLLLVSLVVSAALSAFGQYLSGLLPGMHIIMPIADFAISLGVITLLFAMIYKILPDVEIAWKDVWVGAVITALLFVVGKFLIGLYLGRVATSSTYGAAGAVIIVLLWIYYSAQILFLGAEFTEVYSRRRGSRIVPSENAVPIRKKELAGHKSYPQDKGRFAPEPLPWNAPEKGRLGALGSLLVGMALGVYYSMRRRQRR